MSLARIIIECTEHKGFKQANWRRLRATGAATLFPPCVWFGKMKGEMRTRGESESMPLLSSEATSGAGSRARLLPPGPTLSGAGTGAMGSRGDARVNGATGGDTGGGLTARDREKPGHVPNGVPDGTLTPTPDSPCDSEWRARRGPLDFEDAGPWADDDDGGASPGAAASIPRGHAARAGASPARVRGVRAAQRRRLPAWHSFPRTDADTRPSSATPGRPRSGRPVWEVHVED